MDNIEDYGTYHTNSFYFSISFIFLCVYVVPYFELCISLVIHILRILYNVIYLEAYISFLILEPDENLTLTIHHSPDKAYTRYIYTPSSTLKYSDVTTILTHHKDTLITDIKDVYDKRNRLINKLMIEILINTERENPSTEKFENKIYYITSPVHVYTRHELPIFITDSIEHVQDNLENSFTNQEGSGWRIAGVHSIRVVICEFGKNGKEKLGTYTPYPSNLQGSRHIFNPNSTVNCVLTALSGFLRFEKNPNMLKKNLIRSLSLKKDRFWKEVLNVGNVITDDIQWQDIDKLEKYNMMNINIYHLSEIESYESKKRKTSRHQLHLARRSISRYEKTVSLLLLENNHVCLIRDLKKFYKAFTSHRNEINHICPYCLAIINNTDQYNNHTDRCTSHVTITHPTIDEKIGFSRHQALYPHPYVCFLDFESLNKKSYENNEDNNIISNQDAIAFCYKVCDVRKETKIIAQKTYFGYDCVDVMLTDLMKIAHDLKSQQNYKPHPSPADIDLHTSKTVCDICQSKFHSKNRKVLHHFHYIEMDNYAGTLCNKCNLQLRTPNHLPVIVHNLSYDLTLILKQAHPKFQFSVNKKSGFKFYSGRVKNLYFMDSLNMLSGSLSSLASAHIVNNGRLDVTKETIKNYTSELQSILLSTGKQFMPYEYFDSIDRFQETRLPPKDMFYSHLSQSGISDTDYEHVVKIYNLANCSKLEDYIHLYLELDVSLLSDVYLEWRRSLISTFKLDPLYFLTLSSYSMEAFYLDTLITLDPITTPELYDHISKNIRGGFTSVGQRHVRANNHNVNPDFNNKELKSNYIIYLDFNSLYPTTMSEYKLPRSNFVKLDEHEHQSFLERDILDIDTQGETGYFLNVKIKPASPEVIKRTDSFPLLLSPRNVTYDDLSEYTKRILEHTGTNLPKKNVKLVAHHEGVDQYFITLPYLQFLVRMGLEIERVYCIYKFSQCDYLKAFIDRNIERRSRETNPFIKNALKLINNSLYGRSLLNPLNYATRTGVCNTDVSLRKSFSKPTFKSVDRINDDRYLVTHHKSEVKADSPLYIGFSVLDFAKIKMYSFYYDVLIPLYGERVQFIYSDTDSFILNLETDNLEDEFRGPLAPYLDLSNYPPEHPLHSNQFKGQLGKLKCETPGDYITEIVCLKPKMYAYTTLNSKHKSHNTVKGVPRYIKDNLLLEQFKECLYSNTLPNACIYHLGYNKGDMRVVKSNKILLSNVEDKRYYTDVHHSYGYGHPCIISRSTNGDGDDDDDDDERGRITIQHPTIRGNKKKEKKGIDFNNNYNDNNKV